MDDELLTISEVSKWLKVHESYMYRLMKEGELPVVRRGKRYTRILRSDLIAFIQKHRLEPTGRRSGK